MQNYKHFLPNSDRNILNNKRLHYNPNLYKRPASKRGKAASFFLLSQEKARSSTTQNKLNPLK